MTNHEEMIRNEALSSDLLKLPMYSWWKILLISLFDIDFSEEKVMPSKDPEVLALRESIPVYSTWQMVKLYFQIEPADV